MFRFVIGLISGIAIGAAAAGLSQGQSGQDLRAEFDRIRNDLQDGNFDALGTHLEERFKELHAHHEARLAEVHEAAAEMAHEAAEEAAEATEEVVEEAEEAAKDA